MDIINQWTPQEKRNLEEAILKTVGDFIAEGHEHGLCRVLLYPNGVGTTNIETYYSQDGQMPENIIRYAARAIEDATVVLARAAIDDGRESLIPQLYVLFGAIQGFFEMLKTEYGFTEKSGVEAGDNAATFTEGGAHACRH